MHLILGFGQTGISCLTYCLNNDIPVAVNDTRAQLPYLAEWQARYPQIVFSLGQWDKDLIEQANCIIASPGLALNHPFLNAARAKGTPIIGDIAVFRDAVVAPIVGITGTNGKSTVTMLVYEMAKACGVNVQVGGNIGIPALDLLLQPSADLYVFELSSYQLELVEHLNAKVACILNISPDHLDRYDGSIEKYAQAKQAIYKGCEYAVYNNLDPASKPRMDSMDPIASIKTNEPTSQLIGFAQNRDQAHNARCWLEVDSDARSWIVSEKGDRFPVDSLSNTMSYYLDNVLAALSIGLCLSLNWDRMCEALCAFQGLPHRCQLVDVIEGVEWINDSKGTNIGATEAAIQSIEPHKRIILIAGGDGKGADFGLLSALIEQKVAHVVLFGKDADRIADTWGDLTQVHRVANLDEAVATAHALSRPSDVVLLSPACASTDMFKDYNQRGDCFKALVQALAQRLQHEPCDQNKDVVIKVITG